jgi:cytochrome c55X
MIRIFACGAALVAMASAGADQESRSGNAPQAQRRAELVHLVRQECGSCHGLTMRGGLGPSLEPAALAGKDVEQLRFVILHGRRGTPMPPWQEHLNETEVAWIVEQLKKGLPQ